MGYFAKVAHYQDLRGCRRDESGQMVMEGGNLAEAARCLVVSGLARLRTNPVQRPPEDFSGMDSLPRG